MLFFYKLVSHTTYAFRSYCSRKSIIVLYGLVVVELPFCFLKWCTNCCNHRCSLAVTELGM